MTLRNFVFVCMTVMFWGVGASSSYAIYDLYDTYDIQVYGLGDEDSEKCELELTDDIVAEKLAESLPDSFTKSYDSSSPLEVYANLTILHADTFCVGNAEVAIGVNHMAFGVEYPNSFGTVVYLSVAYTFYSDEIDSFSDFAEQTLDQTIDEFMEDLDEFSYAEIVEQAIATQR